jgi:hypothetical protein
MDPMHEVMVGQRLPENGQTISDMLPPFPRFGNEIDGGPAWFDAEFARVS